MKYSIAPSTSSDAIYIAQRINPADEAELWASYRIKPDTALLVGLRVSRETRTGFANDEPVCMFGVTQGALLAGAATPWLLGTTELPRHARGFLRLNRIYFAEMKREHPVMVNFVDARHKAALRWMAWLGFSIAAAEPFGVDRLPFHRCEMRA